MPRFFLDTNAFKLLVFSYLTGCELFHKISITSKSIRSQLPKARLLNQDRVITVKLEQDGESPIQVATDSFMYALELANAFQVQVETSEKSRLNAHSVFEMILMSRIYERKKFSIDLVVYTNKGVIEL